MNIDYDQMQRQADERIKKLKAFEALMTEAPDMLRIAETLFSWLTESHRQYRELDNEARNLLPKAVKSMPFDSATKSVRDVISKSSCVAGPWEDVGLEHLVAALNESENEK